MAEDPPAHPDEARLRVLIDILGRAVASQAELAAHLRAMRLGGGSCGTGLNGTRAFEAPLPRPTKRDYNYFNELDRRLSALRAEPLHEPTIVAGEPS
jgi:hypothetical protein